MIRINNNKLGCSYRNIIFVNFIEVTFFWSELTVGFLKVFSGFARLTFLLIASGLISSHASRIQLTIVRWGGGFKFPAEVNWLIPSPAHHWSYFSVARALKFLFQLMSGVCIYFVYTLGAIETSIFFCMKWRLCSIFNMTFIRVPNDDEMGKCQELYSPKHESTQCSSFRHLRMTLCNGF